MTGIWEFFFKYPPLVFEKGKLIYASPLPGWVLFLTTAAVVVIAAWTYSRARGKTRPRDRAVLAALRTATFIVLLFPLFRPALQIATAIEQENYVGVLIDDSRSMQIADGSDGPRGAQVRSALGEETDALLKKLGEKYQVRLMRFSGAAEEIGGAGDLTFTGGQSRLGRAMDQARSQLSGVPLAGLVVITDGADQAEAELNNSLLGLRANSVPVFTVGVGREEFDRDIEVRRVSTPREVLEGSSVMVDVVVAQTGFRG
ncbi:MAG: VWA domain-containing protein, partial [Gemmatimonadetes bacterium]|nr:VWA domain-containing protein [Gemmatimonadota bacterium]